MEQVKKDWSVTVLIIDEKSNRVFLIKKRREIKVLPGKEPFTIPSRWAMVGGRRDPGEKDEIETAIREVEEEIGLSVGINPELRVADDRGDHLDVSFIGYPIGGKLKIKSDEVIDYCWFPIKILEVPRLLKSFLSDKNAEMHPNHLWRAQRLLQLLEKRLKRN